MKTIPDNTCPDCTQTMRAAYHGKDARKPTKRIWTCHSDVCDSGLTLSISKEVIKVGVMKKEANDVALHKQQLKEQLWAIDDHVTFGHPPPEGFRSS